MTKDNLWTPYLCISIFGIENKIKMEESKSAILSPVNEME